jgi:hypothetical protein
MAHDLKGKTRRSTMQTARLLGMSVLGVATLSVSALAQAPLKLDFPSASPGIPAYARLELLIPDFDVPKNKHWAAIVFYRSPDCIPGDFNLGLFFDPPISGPGAFGCELLIEGHELWANGPGTDPGPLYVLSRNLTPNLPVWFVSWRELRALFDTGTVTISALESLPSLVRGWAWSFEEQLHPNGIAADPAITLNAHGRLEGGGSFELGWHFQASAGLDIVDIKLKPGKKVADPKACKSGPGKAHCPPGLWKSPASWK